MLEGKRPAEPRRIQDLKSGQANSIARDADAGRKPALMRVDPKKIRPGETEAGAMMRELGMRSKPAMMDEEGNEEGHFDGEDRQQIINDLALRGFSREVLDSMSDEMLNEVLRIWPSEVRSPETEGNEIRQIEKHYEKFREHFPAGFTRASLVSGFRAARKHDRSLTAARFLK